MMVKVIATGISTRPFQYTETPDHTSSRPSDYSLVKEQFFSSRLSSLTCYAAKSYGFVAATVFPVPLGTGEADNSVASVAVNWVS